jgi:hypothetical protein
VISGNSGTITESVAANGNYAYSDHNLLVAGVWQPASGNASTHNAGFNNQSDRLRRGNSVKHQNGF